MNVLSFPRHKLHGGWQHAEPESCPCCDGGLALCVVCCGAEVDLPTCCPGRRLTDAERAAVASGFLDYRRSGWVVPQPLLRSLP